MKIAVAKEVDPSEPRVAISPDTIKKFKALGAEVAIEPGAGVKSGLPDFEFTAVGATVSADALKDADIVIKVKRPEAGELSKYKRGTLVIAIMDPYGNEAALKTIADAGVSAFAMELMPRITRAQAMDVLSSQANLAGYRAVIEAAEAFGRALSDDDDRGRHRSGGESVRDGRRRGRPAGDRDRAPARRHRHRDRRAPGDQGAGRIARRQVPRGRGRGIQERPDRRRLCQGNVEGVPGQAGRADRRARQEAGHRDHHGPDPGPAGAKARQRRDGEIDEAGLGAGRSGRRARRQCRGREGRARSSTSMASRSSATPTSPGRVAQSASSLYARNLFSFIETMVDKANKALAVNWDDELVKATALTKDGAVIHPNFQPKA